MVLKPCRVKSPDLGLLPPILPDKQIPKVGRAGWGRYLLLAIALISITTCCPACGSGGGSGDDSGSKSIARTWDEEILDAIRIDTPRPPVHARNLWHLSAAMYDAWAVYDGVAQGYLTTEKIVLPAEEVAEARREAISYAAYRVLKNRYALSVNSATTLPKLDALMVELGFDLSIETIEGQTAAAVGNRVAAAVITLGDSDGSNQKGNYADPSYVSANVPLVVSFPGNVMAFPNRWQPLALEVAFTQNGIPLVSGLQKFIGSQWNGVTPFALTHNSPNAPYLDPGSQPLLGGSSDQAFKSQMLEIVQKSSELSPDLESTIDISPASLGNNPLGTEDGAGYPINPLTGEAYQSEVVKLGDFGRVLAEFWADGPSSETPPGHWNVIANQISDSKFQSYKFEGVGQPLDRLEWDVKLYFTLNASVHDAAVNCWGLKRIYDSVRPISAIRYMATKGQSSDPGAPSYSPQGLPLVAGLSELITADTWPAGRHAGIHCCQKSDGGDAPCVDSTGNAGTEVSCLGEVAVVSWPGAPADREQSYSGVKWIRGKEWSPYQAKTFVTPAFPGYTSGHSTFSRAAAEVLAAFTGTEFFPGGLTEFVAPKDHFLKFEVGPSEDVRLQWATYFDAADQAGLSRRYGGIHILADDLAGRTTGSEIGKAAFRKAKSYFSSSSNP